MLLLVLPSSDEDNGKSNLDAKRDRETKSPAHIGSCESLHGTRQVSCDRHQQENRPGVLFSRCQSKLPGIFASAGTWGLLSHTRSHASLQVVDAFSHVSIHGIDSRRRKDLIFYSA